MTGKHASRIWIVFFSHVISAAGLLTMMFDTCQFVPPGSGAMRAGRPRGGVNTLIDMWLRGDFPRTRRSLLHPLYHEAPRRANETYCCGACGMLDFVPVKLSTAA